MRKIAIEWQAGKPEGTVEIANGMLAGLAIARGKGRAAGSRFQFTAEGACRLDVTIADERLSHAADPTFVAVNTRRNPFTFLFRDVSRACPIWIPAYGVAVTEAGDRRSCAEIRAHAEARGLQTTLQRLATEPEETYEQAATATRAVRCPTWLGVSRDIRNFEISPGYENAEITARPKRHGPGVPLPELDSRESSYGFVMGRGIGCVRDLTRCLENRILPILHITFVDEDVTYNVTTFATLEKSRLTAKTLRGTHYLVADAHGWGNMLTPEQKAQYDTLVDQELNPGQETVLYWRAQAVNTGSVPRYAWFNVPCPTPKRRFDGRTGIGTFESGRAYLVARLNGKPCPKEQVAVLLQPGQTATALIQIPHSPVSVARARTLGRQDFEARHAECAAFWRQKLAGAAHVQLPEPRLTEMTRAGPLHLDLVTYGREPDGTTAATIGVYCPIGSESSPIIQFMDSMGCHDLARRSLTYFLDKQHDDGFMQNFGGYMLETGAALWSIGEHYRYTRDDARVKKVAPKLVKGCDFMLDWRRRNMKADFRGRGYGMMDGKVADPEDPFHSFMLNAYGYLGMSRVSEMLARVSPSESRRLRLEAARFRADIRRAAAENLARSPVVPLGDGSWCPTLAPWAEARGPLALLTDAGLWYTHGSVVARDSLIGPLYLILGEVLGADERASDFLLDYHCDLMHLRNVALSQPYYSCHPRLHLLRGEAHAFLKAYYNGFAGLADRETYTFWEHHFGASPHKTHEEGWFLMQTRWMLYMERGDTLRLLPGIPRKWLAHGQAIELRDMASYFGHFDLRVESEVDRDRISAEVSCRPGRWPAAVELRLPHPQGRRARRADGGTYSPAKESVTIRPFRGRARVCLEF